MQPSECPSVRSRNAQAQADLRARRKVYIADLQSSNARLEERNRILILERDSMRNEVDMMRSQMKTLKKTMFSDENMNGSTRRYDSLLQAVAVERRKVKRLRCAIKKIAEMDISDAEDDDRPFNHRKRTKGVALVDQFDDASPLLSSIPSLDCQSLATAETDSSTTVPSALSPATPGQRNSDHSDRYNSRESILEIVDTSADDPSQSALTLLLAQPSQFKQQVIQALTQDAQKSSVKAHPMQKSLWSAQTRTVQKPVLDQDDILNRFFQSLSPGDTTSHCGSQAHGVEQYRPILGHLHSASIFLVLLCCCVIRKWDMGW